MSRIIALLVLACTVLPVQASWASERTNVVDADHSDETFELNFLHSGTPELFPVDLSKGVVFFNAQVDGRDTWILLDNGAANSIIDLGLARDLNIEIDESDGNIRTPTSELATKIARQVHVNIPTQFEFTSDLYSVDFSRVSARIGRKIGMVLGNDILANLAFVIDPQFSRGLFVASGAMNLSGGNIQTLPYRDGIVEVVVAGRPARLKLDFGSNHQLTISEHSWRKFFDNETEAGQIRTADASGYVRTEDVRYGVQIEVGRFASDVRATRSVHPDSSIDGHIGFGYFRDKLVVVDQNAGRLTIVQREKPK